MADLRQILLAIQSGGLRHAPDILRYTLLKSRLDRADRAKQLSSPALQPGKLAQINHTQNGADFTFENCSLEVEFLTPDVVRFSWRPGISPPDYTIIWKPQPPPRIAYHQNSGLVTLSSDNLKVVVSSDGSISFLNTDGTTLRDELPPRLAGEAWTSRYRPQPEEFLAGLGLHSGPLNLRNRPHTLWACDAGGNYDTGHDPLYMPLPVYLGFHSHGSYLIFYENPSLGTFTPLPSLQNSQEIDLSFSSGALRYYLIAAPPPIALKRFTQLTGRAPLPPKWSLGYHQSRWGYKSEAEIRQVARGFDEHNLPISAIHLDLDHIDEGRAFSFNPARFPDVPSLTRALSEQGIHLVTILDPGVKIEPQFDIYTAGMNQRVYCYLPDDHPLAGVLWLGRCLYPDFTNPAARAWWGNYYPRLLDLGVRGFWHDMNEPTSFVAWGDLTLPYSTRHALEGSPGDHRYGRNLYGFQMNRAGYDALCKHAPEQRPWILSRSGWVGSQRYAWSWTADSSSRWESMQMNLVSALSLGLSGFAYTGPDIGGFSGNPSPELYVRWFQMAAFMPFFRTHCSIGLPPREPWVFGEPYTGILRSYLNLRYRLLPYFYTLAWEHTQSGAPFIRPLFWNEAHDARLWEVDDAFLLGDAFLVAPVFHPGAQQRSILLPAGDWYDFWSGELLTEPDSNAVPIQLPAPLERLPLLVRAGTVLPLEVTPPRVNLTNSHQGTLELHLYPAKPPLSGGGKLYSDAGDGYGNSRLDSFNLSWQGERLVLDWHSQGDYPFPYQDLSLHLHGWVIKRLWVNGEELLVKDAWRVDRQFSQVLIEVG